MAKITSLTARGSFRPKHRTYGSPDDPEVGKRDAARFCKTSHRTITSWDLLDVITSVPGRPGTYRLSTLETPRAEHHTKKSRNGTWLSGGVRYSGLLRVATKSGIPYGRVTTLLQDKAFVEANKLHPRRFSKIHGFILGLPDSEISILKRVTWTAARNGPPTGFALREKLEAILGITDVSEQIELGEHLCHWVKTGQLEAKATLRIVNRGQCKDGRDRGDKYLRESATYHKHTAIRLWKQYSVKAGVKLCKALLANGRSMKTKVLKAKLKKAGFIGHRAKQILRAAEVSSSPDKVGGSWLSKLGKPKNAEDLLRHLLAKGPVPAPEVHAKLLAVGLASKLKSDRISFKCSVHRAIEKLEISYIRPEEQHGAWLWALPGQSRPEPRRQERIDYLKSLVANGPIFAEDGHAAAATHMPGSIVNQYRRAACIDVCRVGGRGIGVRGGLLSWYCGHKPTDPGQLVPVPVIERSSSEPITIEAAARGVGHRVRGQAMRGADRDIDDNVPLAKIGLPQAEMPKTDERLDRLEMLVLQHLEVTKSGFDQQQAERIEDRNLLKRTADSTDRIAATAEKALALFPETVDGVKHDATPPKKANTNSDANGLMFAPGTVSFRGRPVELRGKPWEILNALWSATDHTMTESQIVDMVWRNENRVLGDTVRSHIKTARKALRKLTRKTNPLPYLDRGNGLLAWKIDIS